MLKRNSISSLMIIFHPDWNWFIYLGLDILDAGYPGDSAVSDLLARAYEDQAQSGLPVQNRADALSPVLSPNQIRRASLNETERQQERDVPDFRTR